MRLSDLHTGQQATIIRVNGEGSFKKRLTEMGFIAQKNIKVIKNAPLKDPIEYLILGYRVSLRRSEAQHIEVKLIEETEEKKEEVFNAFQTEQKICTEFGETLNFTATKEKKDRKVIKIALVGNPNCGKTTLFNLATGEKAHVGNYSGVTVEAFKGKVSFEGYTLIFTDLPGTYSLTTYSPEELYVRKHLVEDKPDLVVNVLDTSNLERNLYLTTQLLDLELPVILALNMYDELDGLGVLHKDILSQRLQVQCVPTIGRTGEGIKELCKAIIELYEGKTNLKGKPVTYNIAIEQAMEQVQQAFQKMNHKIDFERFTTLKMLENDYDYKQLFLHATSLEELMKVVKREQKRLETCLAESTETAIVTAKYAYINHLLSLCFKSHKTKSKVDYLTDRIDAFLTHKWFGFPCFLLILYLMFEATFSLGAYPMEWIEQGVAWLSDIVRNNMPSGALSDLLVDGVIAGVGAVAVFLPNILILYFFISFLEDTGYMARAAFIMDRIMNRLGLHGKSFIPMIMGFGCNVPAIMATRSIESNHSRLITALITPFMSCSARLPIYIVLAGAFFPQQSSLILLSLYVLGIVIAIMSALLFKRWVVKEDALPFVMELPRYRMPVLKSVSIHAWDKGKQYLKKMATFILLFSVVIWFLGYYPRPKETLSPTEIQEQSYIGTLGKAIEPVLAPLGFDWKMSIGILSGIGAKELVVSTLGVIYSIEEDNQDTEALTQNVDLRQAIAQNMTLAAALAYMVFILLYMPCIATVLAIKQESGSWKWACFSIAYSTLLAWLMAYIVYHIALIV